MTSQAFIRVSTFVFLFPLHPRLVFSLYSIPSIARNLSRVDTPSHYPAKKQTNTDTDRCVGEGERGTKEATRTGRGTKTAINRFLVLTRIYARLPSGSCQRAEASFRPPTSSQSSFSRRVLSFSLSLSPSRREPYIGKSDLDKPVLSPPTHLFFSRTVLLRDNLSLFR